MVSFKIGKAEICLDFSFFAVLGIFFAFDPAGYGFCCLLACFCHETGHFIAMLLEKKPPREVMFSGGGICIKQHRDPSVFVLGAGCAVNFCLFFLFCFILERNSIYKLLFGGANLAIGIFNLLPFGTLDGRGLLEKLCYRFLPFYAAEKTLVFFEASALTAAIAAAVLMIASGTVNFTAWIVILYLFAVDFLLKKR